MSYNLKDLINILDNEYNFSIQEKWDNSGFQIGNLNSKVDKILLSMDLSFESVLYAVKNNFNCIITHHPLFFEKILNLEFNSNFYKKLKSIMDNNINVISIHTPLDLHKKGINKALFDICMLQQEEPFVHYLDDLAYGLIGKIESQKLLSYVKKLKSKNNFKNIIFYGDKEKIISKVAVLGGSGAFSIKKAIELEVNLLISSDFKYHDIQYALENSLSLIDLGHFESEFFGLYALENFLKTSLSKDMKIFVFKDNIFKRNII